MSYYEKQYKERAVTYRLEGHTEEETREVFKIGTTTLKQWVKKYKLTGELSKKQLNRSHKKVCPDKLNNYVQEHPDDYQSEMEELFGCSQPCISQTLEKLGITRKERQSAIENKTLQK